MNDDTTIVESSTRDMLVSFVEGSYKKIKYTEWAHKQWIHFTKSDGKQVHVNPKNVNYLEEL